MNNRVLSKALASWHWMLGPHSYYHDKSTGLQQTQNIPSDEGSHLHPCSEQDCTKDGLRVKEGHREDGLMGLGCRS